MLSRPIPTLHCLPSAIPSHLAEVFKQDRNLENLIVISLRNSFLIFRHIKDAGIEVVLE
jgi:hypothetical protein